MVSTCQCIRSPHGRLPQTGPIYQCGRWGGRGGGLGGCLLPDKCSSEIAGALLNHFRRQLGVGMPTVSLLSDILHRKVKSTKIYLQSLYLQNLYSRNLYEQKQIYSRNLYVHRTSTHLASMHRHSTGEISMHIL